MEGTQPDVLCAVWFGLRQDVQWVLDSRLHLRFV